MQPKSNKSYFTLKITVLILLVLAHFSNKSQGGIDQLTQLLQQYALDDRLIEIGNVLSSLI